MKLIVKIVVKGSIGGRSRRNDQNKKGRFPQFLFPKKLSENQLDLEFENEKQGENRIIRKGEGSMMRGRGGKEERMVIKAV